MKPTEILSNALNYSNYVKGGEFSASDILSEPLRVKLRKKYPNVKDVKTPDKVAAWIGTGAHLLFEEYIQSENSFGATNVQAEVKLKFKNISGTADVIVDGNIICDLKTSKEATIKTMLSKPTKWCQQLSIYNYLNHKQNKVQMSDKGYIYWIAVDTRKFGTLEVELLSKEATIELIKNFLAEMEIPIEDTAKCKDCSWLWKWCDTRSKCSYYANNDVSVIEEW